jgi:thiosulfate dehydrogenase [quinone] large subunit
MQIPCREGAGDAVNFKDDRNSRDIAIAYLLLRATLGLNIFMHGLSRIMAGTTAFAATMVPMFRQTILPGWSVYGFGLVLPWAEAVLGLLVLMGLRTRIGLIGGSILIFLLTFGTALRQDWATAGVQLLYAAIYAALLAYCRWDKYSLDAWFRSRTPTTSH